MILQALVDYYNRKAEDPDSDISPQGFENKEIPFLILLDEKGNFIDILDTRETGKKGKKPISKKFKVPQAVKRAGAKIVPYYLWDNLGYVFGIDANKEIKEMQKRSVAFLENVKNLYPQLGKNDEIRALINFLESDYLPTLKKHRYWDEMIQTNANITFQLLGCNHLVCQNSEVIKAISSGLEKKGQKRICLLTGNQDSIARLHHSIKKVRGAQPSGANIVSFNFDSAESFGKNQGDNAQIGEYACFAYTTALNALLNSNQKIIFDKVTTVVFWTERKNSFEDLFSALLDTPPKDDPDRMTIAVKSLYEASKNGALSIQDDTSEFYILGISPNDARLSVRFWHKSTVKELAINIKQHFDDLKIVYGKDECKIFSLYRLMQGMVLGGEVNNLPPNLSGNILKSIFDGTCYPYNLLAITLGRIKDQEGISCRRAAIIKAWLNRYTRKIQINEKEVHVSLDVTNKNIGYRLGRLFAMLEKAQSEAQGRDLNSTIRDRFYGAASTVPISVFPNLLKLKNHHLAKLENKGRAINLEKIICEIMEGISDFPSILTLPDQGRFAIGYYHQQQSFFNKIES